MIAVNDELIKQRVQELARNEKLPCAAALSLAEELGVSPKKICKAANLLKIKISACQLGCFK
ncbi:hypothetical protein K8T06_06380 [bacterium]|nr:hypothetical protein [bacterium]